MAKTIKNNLIQNVRKLPFFISLGKKFSNFKIIYIISKIRNKSKVIIVVIILVPLILLSKPKSAQAIDNSMPILKDSTVIERVVPNYNHKRLIVAQMVKKSKSLPFFVHIHSFSSHCKIQSSCLMQRC